MSGQPNNETRIEAYKNTIGDARSNFFWNTMHQHSNHGDTESMPPIGLIRTSHSFSMKHLIQNGSHWNK